MRGFINDEMFGCTETRDGDDFFISDVSFLPPPHSGIHGYIVGYGGAQDNPHILWIPAGKNCQADPIRGLSLVRGLFLSGIFNRRAFPPRAFAGSGGHFIRRDIRGGNERT
jgi:hypothetical protein